MHDLYIWQPGVLYCLNINKADFVDERYAHVVKLLVYQVCWSDPLLAPPALVTQPSLTRSGVWAGTGSIYAEMRENLHKIITALNKRYVPTEQPADSAENIFNLDQIFLAGFQEPSN